ncbi:hypothetical protein ACFL6U_02910 [Planctomycetota bacterium]
MDHDLYFIPLIARALQHKDTEESLRQAFDEIESLGQQPDYQRGYQQYRQFMVAVDDHATEHESDQLEINTVRALITELATDTFGGSDKEQQMALRIVQSRPQWQREYNTLVAEIEHLHEAPRSIGISILHENKLFESLTFTEIPGSKTIDNIFPGSYTIALATGRVIWQGPLDKCDLLWMEAYPDQALRLSADTGEPEGEPTQQISVLDGEIILRVFAGLESGRIEIRLNLSGTAQ